MEDRISLIECYLLFAKIISKRSTCKRYGTGTVITSTDMARVFSVGYNGPPHSTEHNCKGEVGDCFCIHGEINALLKKNTVEPGIMFLTHSPCMGCARLILQANIERIFFLEKYRVVDAIEFLQQHNIIMTHTVSGGIEYNYYSDILDI